jgi:hypothetical protein
MKEKNYKNVFVPFGPKPVTIPTQETLLTSEEFDRVKRSGRNPHFDTVALSSGLHSDEESVIAHISKQSRRSGKSLRDITSTMDSY